MQRPLFPQGSYIRKWITGFLEVQLGKWILLYLKYLCLQDISPLRYLSWLSDHGFCDIWVPFTIKTFWHWCPLWDLWFLNIFRLLSLVLILLLDNIKLSMVSFYSENEHALSLSHWDYKLFERRTISDRATCSNWIR